jgi:hypothetical protein
VKSVSAATDECLKFIFERFEFHSDTSSIINRLSSELRQLSVPSERLEQTRKHVVGAFKESKFSKIVGGDKVVITFDDFRTSMGFDRIIRSARADPVDFDRFVEIYYSYQRPDTLSFSNSKFHDQLKDIGISEGEIIDRGIEMMLAEDFMESLRQAGSFTASENTRLESIAVSEWQLVHKQTHRHTDNDDELSHKNASVGCYDLTMQRSLKSGEIELPINLSCGKYIKLSNLPRIGWRNNWKNTFTK